MGLKKPHCPDLKSYKQAPDFPVSLNCLNLYKEFTSPHGEISDKSKGVLVIVDKYSN